MEPVILSWTPTNWATVFLMALGGFLILKVIVIGVKKASSMNSAATA
jgi:hypothetical protein